METAPVEVLHQPRCDDAPRPIGDGGVTAAANSAAQKKPRQGGRG